MKVSKKLLMGVILIIAIVAIIAVIYTNLYDNQEITEANTNPNNVTGPSKINWSSNLKESLVEAKASNKSVLLYFTASWCPYCAQMESETFPNEDVENKISNEYIPVKIDGDENPGLCSKYEVVAYPTIVILDSGGVKKSTIRGFKTADELLKEI